jgi:hypothetical protein
MVSLYGAMMSFHCPVTSLSGDIVNLTTLI